MVDVTAQYDYNVDMPLDADGLIESASIRDAAEGKNTTGHGGDSVTTDKSVWSAMSIVARILFLLPIITAALMLSGFVNHFHKYCDSTVRIEDGKEYRLIDE